jgi:hypothetical protein
MHPDRSSFDRDLKPLPMPSVLKIIPTTQRYDWGKRGSKSKVAQLAVASKLPDFQLDENAPYAEVILVFYLRKSQD